MWLLIVLASEKLFLVEWHSIETHRLVVMQQIVLSTAHNIYRPFTIYSDLLLCLTTLPRLYSYKKVRGVYISCLFSLYCFTFPSPFLHLLLFLGFLLALCIWVALFVLH